MDVVQLFGSKVSNLAQVDVDRARSLLLFGWKAQMLKLRAAPDKRLPKSRQYAAQVAMRKVLDVFGDPAHAAAMSVFAPYEPLAAAGYTPFSVEQISCWMAGSQTERLFLDAADEAGFAETMCSYHRTFLGAWASGILPEPAFSVYTTLACDGNLITFPWLTRTRGVPGFCIDVPYERSEDSVREVIAQLHDLMSFICEQTGKPVDERALVAACERSWRCALAWRRFFEASPGRRLPADMTSEMYAFLMNHVVLGSPESERFCQMLADEMEKAPASKGLRIVWLHTMPFSQAPAIQRLNFNDHAFITACDLSADPLLIDVDPRDPYDAMARRLVYSCMNGPVQARIDRALDLVKRTDADGVVVFGHWGCKATLGAAALITAGLEDAGVPCLVLDGDGVYAANRSDGQTATRLDACLELLGARVAGAGRGAA